jgi:hypothetical protein
MPIYSKAQPAAAAYTLATLPPVGSYIGQIVQVTDVGKNGSAWQWSGTVWAPVSGSVLLHLLGSEVDSVSNTNEQVLDYISLPAGLMSAGAELDITYTIAPSVPSTVFYLAFRLGVTHTTADALFEFIDVFTGPHQVTVTFKCVTPTSVFTTSNYSGTDPAITVPDLSTHQVYLSLTVRRPDAGTAVAKLTEYRGVLYR